MLFVHRFSGFFDMVVEYVFLFVFVIFALLGVATSEVARIRAAFATFASGMAPIRTVWVLLCVYCDVFVCRFSYLTVVFNFCFPCCS